MRFEYAPAPHLEAVDPRVGGESGGDVLHVRGDNLTPETTLLIGSALVTARPLLHQTWVSPREMRGVLPAGRGRANVWAVDPALGWSLLHDAFVWGPP
jgi:hypothetical protein